MTAKRTMVAACAVMAAAVAMGFPGDDGEGMLELRESPLLPKETKAEKDARMAWWAEARFGMFIHFGLYAALGRHEWVQKHEKIRPEDYEARYKRRFNPDQFSAKDWVARAKAAGMKYIVLTTKHHEGFCMWDTKTTDYKITNTDFGRDLVREYVDALRAEGLKVGFYFSIKDWHHPDYLIDATHPLRPQDQKTWSKETFARLNEGRDWNRYRKYMWDQIDELLTNYGKIDILFYDMSFPQYITGKGHKDWGSEELLTLTRKLQPGIIVNCRLDLIEDPCGYDFLTPEQKNLRACPVMDGKKVAWETCQTFSGSWGYYRDELTWKSTAQIIAQLPKTVSLGGNLIMNVGPTGRGEFDDRAMSRLADYGKWRTRTAVRSTAAARRRPSSNRRKGLFSRGIRRRSVSTCTFSSGRSSRSP